MHAERRGQAHSNQIDWKVAALDGLGLLLFFVPGAVAFAVDFYTGAIYLPMEQAYPQHGSSPMAPLWNDATDTSPLPATQADSNSMVLPLAFQQHQPAATPTLRLKRVSLPREQLQPQQLEQVVANHVGKPISLDDTRIRLSELACIDQFDEQLIHHRRDLNFGSPVRSFFSRLKQGDTERS